MGSAECGGPTLRHPSDHPPRQRDTFFEALLSSGTWEPNQRGQYEIDRSPTYFAHILLYLHSGKLDVWTFSDEQLRELQQEMDFYAITSQSKTSDVRFDRDPNEAAAIRLSPSGVSVRCLLFMGDVRLVLPPSAQSGALLLSFTVSGNNSDFMLYSSDNFGQAQFFANFYVPHRNAIPIPALPRYVLRITRGQVAFVSMGGPPIEPLSRGSALKVAAPIPTAALTLHHNLLFFRLWSGVQLDLLTV